MAAAHLSLSIAAFVSEGYAVYDGDLASRGEVAIFSPGWAAPDLGDEFIIESGGRAHDVEVREVVLFDDGGWSARCQVIGWV